MRRELIGMSKFLSLVLRHKPEIIGITLDESGWTDVQTLVDYASIYQTDKNLEPITKSLLEEIVNTNEKRRFEYSDDGWKIRARQGHSIDVELGYKSIVPPKYLFHGTALCFVASIRVNGIDKRKRHHVHLSEDHDTAIKVGKRHGIPYILRIDAEAMHKDGLEFFKSDNNVWLAENIPTKYIDFNYNGTTMKKA